MTRSTPFRIAMATAGPGTTARWPPAGAPIHVILLAAIPLLAGGAVGAQTAPGSSGGDGPAGGAAVGFAMLSCHGCDGAELGVGARAGIGWPVGERIDLGLFVAGYVVRYRHPSGSTDETGADYVLALMPMARLYPSGSGLHLIAGGGPVAVGIADRDAFLEVFPESRTATGLTLGLAYEADSGVVAVTPHALGIRFGGDHGGWVLDLGVGLTFR